MKKSLIVISVVFLCFVVSCAGNRASQNLQNVENVMDSYPEWALGINRMTNAVQAITKIAWTDEETSI